MLIKRGDKLIIAASNIDRNLLSDAGRDGVRWLVRPTYLYVCG